MSTLHVHVQTTNWNQKMTDRVSGDWGYLFGKSLDIPNTLVLSMPPNGATRYFCTAHERIYPFNSTCPDCNLEPVSRVCDGLQGA